MKAPLTQALLIALCAASCTRAQTSKLPDKHSSIRLKGPNGLQAYTVYEKVESLEDQGHLPVELVITRNGKVIRTVNEKDGGPFFWNFNFLPGGKRIAIQSGPLHFAMTCTLMDIDTGKHLQDYDCFHEPLAQNAPAWVKQLVDSQPLTEITE